MEISDKCPNTTTTATDSTCATEIRLDVGVVGDNDNTTLCEKTEDGMIPCVDDGASRP